MTPTTRLLVNTIAQNIRTVINICLSLYSTRLVLDILGESDYGIYMLVAGVVSFLSYFTNAMISTTQRHISYSHGKNDLSLAKKIFSNSYIINCILGLFLTLALASITFWLFNGKTLNIAADKYVEAEWVYLVILSSVFFSFITAPFRALFIARENIVYISIIDVLDGVLKVALVFTLYLFETYRLVAYACIISLIMLLNFLAFALYARKKYDESCIIPKISDWNTKIQRELIGFTTWTIYGSICVFFRTQGIAVLLNKFYSTVINASYGIATQILGSISFLSTAILNAFTPQIIKAEGAGDRGHMLFLCQKACKYCYFLLLIFSIPIIFEMDSILMIWLGKTPDFAPLFCRIFLISTIIDQVTIGFNAANQALGKIRNYTILIYTTKLVTIPFVFWALNLHCDMLCVLSVYVVFESLSAALRLPYIVKTTGLRWSDYYNNVLLKLLVPTIVAVAVCYIMTTCVFLQFRFLLTILLCVSICSVAIWVFGLGTSEKNFVMSKVRGRRIFL